MHVGAALWSKVFDVRSTTRRLHRDRGRDVHEEKDDAFVLEHFASVTDPALFQNFAINAVVEGTSPGEIYMTEWLPYGLPSTGWGCCKRDCR